MTIRALAVVLIITFLFSTLFFVLLWKNSPSNLEQKLWMELAKALLQLAVIVVIGGVVASLFKAAERSSENLRRRNEIREDYLKRVGGGYRSVKAIRRRLRAAGLTKAYGSTPGVITDIQVAILSVEMELLNESQLELEALKFEARSLPSLLGLAGLPGKLRKMEDYLRQIITEYQKKKPLFVANTPVNFSDLERLDEFTWSSKKPFSFKGKKKSDYRFRSHFSASHIQVSKKISNTMS